MRPGLSRAEPVRLFLTADAVGGVWQHTLDLARGLCRVGFEVVVATLGPPPGLGDMAAARGIAGLTLVPTVLPLDWTAETPKQLEAAAREVAGLAAVHGADIVQVHAPALAAADYDAPVVAVTHSCMATWWHAVRGGPLPDDFRWRVAATEAGLRYAEAVVAPSVSFAQLLAATYRLQRFPVVIHNGRSRPAAVARAAGSYAITAGRLWDEGKNVATLDRAAASAALPIRAAGAVRGPNGAVVSFEHLALLGQLDEAEMRQCIASALVYVSAARYEPFGLAVLEAAQAGVPLVLSDISTFRELWQDAAVLVAPDDAKGFAAAIDALAANTSWRRRLGAAACRCARRYGCERMARSYAALYRAVSGGPAQRKQVALG